MSDEVQRYWTAELWDHEETHDAMVVLAADYDALQAKLAKCQHTVRVLESSEEDAQQAAAKFKAERDKLQHEIECLEAEVDRMKIELGNTQRENDDLRRENVRLRDMDYLEIYGDVWKQRAKMSEETPYSQALRRADDHICDLHRERDTLRNRLARTIKTLEYIRDTEPHPRHGYDEIAIARETLAALQDALQMSEDV